MPGAPEGPLKGLTFAVKDLYDVAGHRTGFGHPLWLETHAPAQATAPTVQALLTAGASLHGKTHLDELAYSLNGENVHYGTPVNPAAPGRIPGGSSSGSAAAVAAGQVDFALGSDTGGSVRVPASFCGLLGVRPTWGRVSLEAARPLAPSFDTAGWFARDPAVLRAVGSVLLSPPTHGTPGPSRLGRLLLARDAFTLADPPTRAAISDALSVDGEPHSRLSSLLGPLSEVDVAAPLVGEADGAPEGEGLGSLADWAAVFRVTQGAEAWREHGPWVTAHKPSFGPGIAERFAAASAITSEQWAAGNEKRRRIRAHLLALLGSDGVLALPTTPGPAPLANTPPVDVDTWRARLLSLTCIAGLAGLPQVHLPLATVDGGLPVGLGLIGPPGSDEALLDLSVQIMESLK